MVKVHDGGYSYTNADEVVSPVYFRNFRSKLYVDGIDGDVSRFSLSNDRMWAEFYLSTEHPIAWYSSLDKEIVRQAVVLFYDGSGSELERLDRAVLVDGWEVVASYDENESGLEVARIRLSFVFA